MEGLQYPIGRFQWTGESTAADRATWIRIIEGTPSTLHDAVIGLRPEQLDTPYRDGGWTVRQVVHHYADDHMNAYVRFKLALTEDAPPISGYSEASWAELPDTRWGPIEPSLQLLRGLHQRWVIAWRSLNDDEWERTFLHPVRGAVTLAHLAALYAWHGRHHVAQIVRLRERKIWITSA